MTIREDDRTPEQKRNYPCLVIGTDSFMSGWGGASDGVSIAVWACRPEDRIRVLSWVHSRSEMKRVRESYDNGGNSRYRPSGNGDCHIYLADENHCSVS